MNPKPISSLCIALEQSYEALKEAVKDPWNGNKKRNKGQTDRFNSFEKAKEAVFLFAYNPALPADIRSEVKVLLGKAEELFHKIEQLKFERAGISKPLITLESWIGSNREIVQNEEDLIRHEWSKIEDRNESNFEKITTLDYIPLILDLQTLDRTFQEGGVLTQLILNSTGQPDDNLPPSVESKTKPVKDLPVGKYPLDDTETLERYKKKAEQMPKSLKNAYAMYFKAIRELGQKLTEKELTKFINENKEPECVLKTGTILRYIRKAKVRLGIPKNWGLRGGETRSVHSLDKL